MTNGADRRWRIACQDVLKSRDKVLEFASEALIKEVSVIIDRCNFDSVQRRHWTKLADEKQAEIQFQYECGKAHYLPDNYQLSNSTGNTPQVYLNYALFYQILRILNFEPIVHSAVVMMVSKKLGLTGHLFVIE
jgi:hypothetical protein